LSLYSFITLKLPDETLNQFAQAAVDKIFANHLNREEHGFAVQIAQEIKYLYDKNLPVEQWRNHVTDFEQSLQAKLNQAQTASQRSALRFACLWLQQNAGQAVEQVYNKLPEQQAYYKQGVEQAEQFLAQGETAAFVREVVLRLYLNAGLAYGKQDDWQKEIDTYLKALSHAEAFLTAGETASGVREQVLRLYSNAGLAYEQQGDLPQAIDTSLKALSHAEYAYEQQGNLPQAIDTYLKGLSHAEAFLTAGETASGVREEVLRLYSNAGATYEKQGDLPQAIDTYLKGLSHAEDFLTAGETATGVRELVLKLYSNAGATYEKQGDLPQAIDTYLKGLSHAEAFLTAGETASGVREQVLSLYGNAGAVYEKQGNLPQAIDTFLKGLSHAEDFLTAGETASGVREEVLRLCVNAAVTYGEQDDLQKEIDISLKGLSHAEDFLTAGETASGVREQVLSLYINAAVTYGQQGDLQKEIDTSLKGLSHAEDFLTAGETASGVRKQVLRLYINAAVTYGQQGDLQKKIDTYLKGLSHAEAFLTAGETASGVREQVLSLYYNAGVAYRKQGNLPQAIDTYLKGLSHAEAFLTAGETASGVREYVLNLYANAGYAYEQQGNLPQAIDTSLKGLSHAEAFLTAGETASGVRELVLRLYDNAGVVYEKQGELPQAIDTFLKGLSHAEAFLTAGETASGVREKVLRLYYNAGLAYGKQGKFQQAIDTYLKGLSHAEAFLTAGETASGVREYVLKLYSNAAVTYGQQGDLPQAIDTYLKGMSRAEAFLAAGETASGVREPVLRLYDNCSSSYYNSGQTHAVIPLLPMKGLWSWVALAQLEPNHRENIILHNWQNKLNIAPSFRHVTTAFQTSLRSLVLDWHSPKRPHRHFGFIETATLLTLSEGLYALTQAQQNKPLDKAYQHLTILVKSEYIQTLQQLDSQQQQYLEQLDRLNQRRWWTRWPLHRWWLTLKIEDYQQRKNHQMAQAEQWELAVKRVHSELVIWLTSAIKSSLGLPSAKESRREDEGLSDLPAIALGILLASHSVQTGATVEALITEWHHEPPWQTAEQLLTTLAPSQWQNWANDPHQPVLYKWVYSLERNDTVRRLKITWAVENNPQPQLQTWLRELDSKATLESKARLDEDESNTASDLQSAEAKAEALDSSSAAKAEALDSRTKAEVLDSRAKAKVLDKVKAAWQSALKAADPLAQIFTALADPKFQGDLFAARKPTDTACQQALAAVVLGDVDIQIERVVDDWLKQQTAEHTAHNELLNQVTNLKYRFDRIIALIRKQHHKPIEQEAVHGWAQAYLTEIKIPLKPPVSIPKQQTITLVWETLERARVGLNSLTLHQPDDDWKESLGKQLWKDLEQSISWLSDGHQPTAQEMWPPLETWLNQIGGWLSKPLTAKQCQNHLGAKEALLQPFFDPTHQRLRVLWLDQHCLELRELPEECAQQSNWTSADGLMKQWADGLNLLRSQKKPKDWDKLLQKAWEEVMQSAPVTQLANTLNHWATQQQLEQLTIIFPAPLGQLPWETLEPLEELLVREVSLAHWFKHTTAQRAANPSHPQEAWWVVCGPSGEAKCIPQEAQWVANYYNTTPEAPCTSVFKALSQLANTSHAHLVTHGQFDDRHPNLGPTHHALGL